MKSINYFIKFGLTFLISVCILSCENNVEEEDVVAVGNSNPLGPNLVISFSKNVKPIIDNNCVECHAGNRFPDMRSHAIIARNSALIKNVVVTRRMPRGKSLTNKQIATIEDWIDSGALDN